MTRFLPLPAGPLESGLHDPGDSLPSMNLLGNLSLVREPTSSARPIPWYCPSVFSRKITKSMTARSAARRGDSRGWMSLTGRKLMYKSNRNRSAEQDIACVLVARHSRVSQRADENGVGLVSQVLEAWIRKGLPGLEIVVGRPGQPFDLERWHRPSGPRPRWRESCVYDLRTNAVTRNEGDAVGGHSGRRETGDGRRRWKKGRP